jgi:hypothetical protein
MGKTGSSSLRRYLQEGLDVHVPHTHFLSSHREELENYISKQPQSASNGHLADSRRVWDALDAGLSVVAVSSVRDPFSRNVSAYLQNLDRLPKKFMSMSTEQLVKDFLEKYPHHVPIRWFDSHVRRALGIDVYSDSTSEGPVRHYRSPNSANRLVVFRQAELSEVAPAVLEALLGIPRQSFPATNQTLQKHGKVSPRIEEFIASVRYPQEIATPMLESQYVRHFFGPLEIEQMKLRWVVS